MENERGSSLFDASIFEIEKLGSYTIGPVLKDDECFASKEGSLPVVVISTHINEIGQEQYCAKFHDNSLREIVFNEANGIVATCGDNCIKVVSMSDWKEFVEYLDGNSTAFSNAAYLLDHSFSSPSDAFGSNSTTGAVHATSVSYENLQWTPHA
ncbi:hypothetical protein PsorP6_005978 [Peronosclerospora sorghi]|uniref:Uncharacterized protein n=1 Tax=Peronosclerospora sorghi TaxID=230839 RepID=A0ACC0W3T7_9STRA|nr:hypothetical protein PsorP6_005978 [Peronosclerospora sorghi]